MNQRVIFYSVFLGCAMVGLSRAEQVTLDSAAARPNHTHLDATSIAQLKLAYLECDRRSTNRLLDFHDAAQCSMIHEALKERGFGGDFGRMLAWWKAEKVAAATLPRD